MKKDVRLDNAGEMDVAKGELSNLSLFSILLSVSALANAQARWILANLDKLRGHGGYAAAADLQLVADVLIAMVEENLEEWQKIEVPMPPGFVHVPWSVRKVTPDEKGDLPF